MELLGCIITGAIAFVWGALMSQFAFSVKKIKREKAKDE